MYSTVSTRLTHEAAKVIAFGAIPAYLVPIGDKIEYTARQILYQNFTDDTVWISLNGLVDGFALRSGQDMIQDITINQAGDRGLFLPVGEYIYVRADTPLSVGFVSVTVFYGQD